MARAQGVAGLHPDYPGVPIPGVVGVLCVAPDHQTGLPPGGTKPWRALYRRTRDGFIIAAIAP